MWAPKKSAHKIKKKEVGAQKKNKNVGANVGKKKVMRIAHIFFVKVVGAFSEKKSFWKSSRGKKIEIYVQKKLIGSENHNRQLN